VLQVSDWAQRQAGDRLTYAVALVCDDADMQRLSPGHGRGPVWLVGMDGHDQSGSLLETPCRPAYLIRSTTGHSSAPRSEHHDHADGDTPS
jgi:hypothetical protein